MLPKFVVHADVQDFPVLNMELSIPKDTIILTPDTPIANEIWKLAGINDPVSEIKIMDKMGVKAILYDPVSKTKVSIISKQSPQSKRIFHLSSLTEEELNDFLSNVIDQDDESTTYNIEKYQQYETTFFRLYVEAVKNNQQLKELVYGTIVNGEIITFHMYQDKAEAAINESYVKSLVDGVHFTKYYDADEIRRQERLSIIFRIASTVVLLISFSIWILLLRKKRLKYSALAKRKTDLLSNFYLRKRETGYDNTDSTILFLNSSEYSKNVFNTFFLYNEVISKMKQWIKLTVLYIVIFALLYIGGSGILPFILIIILISMFFYLKKLAIEKLVKQEMKIFNINDRMEIKFHFYEDYLTMIGEQQNINYPYLQITKVREYKNYIYLYLDMNKAIYLNKDGFDLNDNDFVAFINEKLI